MKPPAFAYRCAKQNRPPRSETWPRMCQTRTKTWATLCHPRWHCRNPTDDKLLTASWHLGQADLFRGELCALFRQAFILAVKWSGFVKGGRLCLFSLCPGLGALGLWFDMARLRNAGYFNIYPQFLLCGTHHTAPSSFSASGVRWGHNRLLGRGVRQSHRPAMRQGQPPLLGSLLTAPCAGFLWQGKQTPLARPGSLKQSLFVPGSNRYRSPWLYLAAVIPQHFTPDVVCSESPGTDLGFTPAVPGCCSVVTAGVWSCSLSKQQWNINSPLWPQGVVSFIQTHWSTTA